MTKNLIVAIDGPAGSGKSTTAKLVAQKLGYLYIDTGAMYRAITCLVIKNDIGTDKKAVIDLTRKTDIKLDFIDGQTKVYVNNNDITDEIRSPEVNGKVSEISTIKEVREILVSKQREMAGRNRGIVMEGRDIGTVVFPDADVKFFMTASIEQRAKRRLKEYADKGINISLGEIKENILTRDKIDSGRETSPLTKSHDAVEVNTSDVTIDEQVSIILKEIGKAADKKGITLSHLN